MVYIILMYLFLVNIAGLAFMGIDKSRARKGAWRISEKMLFGISLIGGSVGTWVGMYMFRHKTRHWYFVIGMPFILVLQIVLVVYLIKQF